MNRSALPIALAGALALSGCGDAPSPETSAAAPAAAPEAAAPENPADLITAESLMAHIEVLASDEFEGRAPMSEGERLTLDYLENAFRDAGLEPMFGDSYRQPVALVSIEADPDTAMTVTGGTGDAATLAYGADTVYGTGQAVAETGLEDSELVWVGYGIVAPEFGWNDYEGLDMEGKTAVILVNDPGFATEDPDLFNGRSMTYYGRWTYKYEEATRQGAAGALIVHQTEPASYGWNVVETGWTGPQFHLATDDGGAGRLALEGWVRHEIAQDLLARAGLDFETLAAEAAQSSDGSRPLGVRVSAPIRNTLSYAESFNVGGIVKGSERPEELFIYMGHWDHMGVAPHEPGEEGDFIYNGAEDNASGTAALIEMGRAFAATEPAPARSVGFLAVTAEESGLLGSLAYADNPAFPMNRTVGGINMDVLNFRGIMEDIVVTGFGASEMEDILARHTDRRLTPEPTPEAGYYYRSDHFNFAKKGVPILVAKGGTVHRELGADIVTERNAAYRAERYHAVGDEIQDDWEVDGAIEDLHLYYAIGRSVADSDAWPAWYEGNEFKAIREASLAGD